MCAGRVVDPLSFFVSRESLSPRFFDLFFLRSLCTALVLGHGLALSLRPDTRKRMTRAALAPFCRDWASVLTHTRHVVGFVLAAFCCPALLQRSTRHPSGGGRLGGQERRRPGQDLEGRGDRNASRTPMRLIFLYDVGIFLRLEVAFLLLCIFKCLVCCVFLLFLPRLSPTCLRVRFSLLFFFFFRSCVTYVPTMLGSLCVALCALPLCCIGVCPLPQG